MRAIIRIVLVVACLGVAGVACKKKPAKQDVSKYRTAESSHQKIQEVRLQLVEALQQKDLKFIHDRMYYFRDLLVALSDRVEGEKKQRIDGILRDLTQIAHAIDNSAGRGNQTATEANIQKLIDRLEQLETEFKAGQ